MFFMHGRAENDRSVLPIAHGVCTGMVAFSACELSLLAPGQPHREAHYTTQFQRDPRECKGSRLLPVFFLWPDDPEGSADDATLQSVTPSD